MKKFLFSAAVCLIAGLCPVALTSCGEKKADEKKPAKENVKKAKTDSSSLPNYRYVDSDSILANYLLSKDYQEEMLRLQNNYDNTARQRQSAIQNLANQIQTKGQNNGYLSEASYKQDMTRLQQMQSSAESEIGKLQVNMQNAMLEAQKAVNDSIINFVKEYNASHGYDAILLKGATIYINPDLDITNEIIEGLNARYNNVKK